MIHVYALVDPGGPPVDGPGVDGAGIRLLEHGEVGIVVSSHDAGLVAPSAEAALAHAAVCDRLLAGGRSVLPVRFGTRFADEAAAHVVVDDHEQEIVDALDRVRGFVEIGLRVLWSEPAPTAPPAAATRDVRPGQSSGRTYLMARVAEEQRRRTHRTRADRVAERIHTPLAARACDARCRMLVTPALVLSAAYLVPEGDLEEFRRAVSGLAAEHDDVDLLCTGPWPPYHFADLPGAVS